MQDDYSKSKEWQDIALKAYPPAEIKKKEKKVRDRGSRFPGAKGDIEVKPDGRASGEGKAGVNVAGSAEDAMQNLNVSANGPAT